MLLAHLKIRWKILSLVGLCRPWSLSWPYHLVGFGYLIATRSLASPLAVFKENLH